MLYTIQLPDGSDINAKGKLPRIGDQIRIVRLSGEQKPPPVCKVVRVAWFLEGIGGYHGLVGDNAPPRVYLEAVTDEGETQ